MDSSTAIPEAGEFALVCEMVLAETKQKSWMLASSLIQVLRMQSTYPGHSDRKRRQDDKAVCNDGLCPDENSRNA